MRRANVVVVAALALGSLAAAPGCASVSYSFWEMLGKEKRDLLRSSLLSLVDDQNEAKEEFGNALDRVKALTGFEGGDLEAEYDRLKSAYEGSRASADAVDSRIADIEEVAEDLFEEWQSEIETMRTPTLRADSQRKLADTRSRYATMHASMLASRRAMDPALTLLNDQVLYLKHNLNAQAVGALGGSMAQVEESIRSLQQSIEASIREAQGFIDTME